MKKTFLGIGIGPGIGLSTALRFAREGYQPIIASRSLANLAPLAERITKETGVEVETVEFDAASLTDYQNLAEKFGHVDVLLYHAAVLRPQDIDEMTYEGMDLDITVNLTGAIAAVKAFSGPMVSRGSGSILLTGGGLALNPMPQFLNLSIGKAGIRCLAQALFENLAEKGVHIVSMTVTKVVDQLSSYPDEIAEAYWQLHQQPKSQWVWEKQI